MIFTTYVTGLLAFYPVLDFLKKTTDINYLSYIFAATPPNIIARIMIKNQTMAIINCVVLANIPNVIIYLTPPVSTMSMRSPVFQRALNLYADCLAKSKPKILFNSAIICLPVIRP